MPKSVLFATCLIAGLTAAIEPTAAATSTQFVPTDLTPWFDLIKHAVEILAVLWAALKFVLKPLLKTTIDESLKSLRDEVDTRLEVITEEQTALRELTTDLARDVGRALGRTDTPHG